MRQTSNVNSSFQPKLHAYLGVWLVIQSAYWFLFPHVRQVTIEGFVGYVVFFSLVLVSLGYAYFGTHIYKGSNDKIPRFFYVVLMCGFALHLILSLQINSIIFDIVDGAKDVGGRFRYVYILVNCITGPIGDIGILVLAIFTLKLKTYNKGIGTPYLEQCNINKAKEWTEAILVALLLALIIRGYFFQAFKIPSGSMEDTLLVGDHLLVNKFIFGTKVPILPGVHFKMRDPKLGDVIVFEFPEDKVLQLYKRRDFIKRVIGVPGDVVEVRNKSVYVNGQPLEIPQEIHKDYLAKLDRDNMSPVKVTENHYFVMGDNRDHSYDSRFWGLVERSEIKGLAFIKYWSWDGIKHRPRWGRIGRLIH